MNVIQEFSRFASLYDTHNIIQAQVAIKLVSMIESRDYCRVIDMGCGSGSIYKNILKSDIFFKEFLALDFSNEMLDIHPTSIDIEKRCFDFNNSKSFELLKQERCDLFVSSSALQWSRDLDMTLRKISQLSKVSYFSFFTSNTFATLHKIASIESPIYSKETIINTIKKYYNSSFEIVEYHLEFETVYQMFQYIKKSGVSGGERKLSYKQMKEVMKNYPLGYLEFEVLFIKATPKCC